MAIPIVKNNITLTPHSFYNDLLLQVALYYKDESQSPVEFQLIGENDFEAILGKYRIDPIVIPLLLSVGEQLKKFHKHSINLYLKNNSGTNDIIEFLYRCDFFYIVGNNINPNYPIGRNIFNFDESYIGGFSGKLQRKDHKVRCYSLNDDNLRHELKTYTNEEDRRDFLVEYYIYKVKDHFSDLLFNNPHTKNEHNLFIDILSELITNGVLHSKSDTFALMFVDRFKSKFSISDNGVGLEFSMKNKVHSFYYRKNTLSNILSSYDSKLNVPAKLSNNLHSIFESLYYSLLKDRAGLFDLMCNVVIRCKGYFRLHTENCQIIVSNRMNDNLMSLFSLRRNILECHNNWMYTKISTKIYQDLMTKYSAEALDVFKIFYEDLVNKYSNDNKFSSIRFYLVKFKGVHIEVEIPNS